MNLVEIKDNNLVVSSLVIAENVHYEHETVIRLIRENKSELEEFGMLRFENGAFKDSLNRTQNRVIALLNENQAMLIMTFMRNNEIIKKFKIALIKAFSLMKEQLQNKNNFEVPKTMKEALYLAYKQAETIELQQKQLEDAKPKIEIYDDLMNCKNNLNMTQVGNIVGIGRNTLFAILRDKKILKTDNTPYQIFINLGYFNVIVKPINSCKQAKTQTVVTSRGLEFINKLLKKEFDIC